MNLLTKRILSSMVIDNAAASQDGGCYIGTLTTPAVGPGFDHVRHLNPFSPIDRRHERNTRYLRSFDIEREYQELQTMLARKRRAV